MTQFQNIMHRVFYLFLIGILLLTVSCSNSYSGKADIGANSIAIPGIPHITVTTSSNINDQGQTQGVLYHAVTENSLIFKKIGNELINRSTLTVEISSKNGFNALTQNYPLRFKKDVDAKYYEQNDIIRRKVFGLQPGEYSLRISITDDFSGKQSTIEKELKIPDPEAEDVFISNVWFFVKPSSNSNYIAVNKYHVNSGYDSLKFSFQVTNGIESEVLEIQSSLKRFRSMSGRAHRISSIEYKGLDYSSSETIQSNLRELGVNGSVTIENTFANLQNGNYRFEVKTRSTDDTYYEVRDFSIKSTNFPQVKTAHELARPLVYLMRDKEFKKLMAIKDPKEMKAAIDRFWLSNVQNSNTAKNVISFYYQRVEEANKQFSNFKEGWKTDSGMIYILFGPPWYNDQFSNEMVWSYSYNREDPEKNFLFSRTKINNKYFPFNNYLLNRSNYYFTVQNQQIQD